MSTPLDRFFGAAVAAHPGLSGFTLLSHAREAFIARLALADLATRTLDMQYYVWDGDSTGRIIVDRVMKAAERGVRVRLLVDDPYYNKASDPVKAALDAHPNVEIRLFNPARSRRFTRLDFLLDFRRFNRRMHNKLMVADNAAAIVGGRNVGDAYYGVHTASNFRDLDVLAVGSVVSDLTAVFERYWDSVSTVPIATIVGRPYGAADLEAILTRLRQEIDAADYPYPIDQHLDELASGAALRDSLVWAQGRIIADDPAAVAHGRDADDVVAFIRGRVGELKEELLVEAPYFVLHARARATVKALIGRGVRVRVLTNSLASNNQIAAHSGYAKTRRPLLESGLELYELRADTDAFRPGWSVHSGQSRAALHTKAMVFDRKAVFIGSFNLDPRSAVINTEAGLYIESPELAERLTAYMETGVAPANSYRLRLAPEGGIVWETLRAGETARYRDEPETSFGWRFVAGLVKLLPIDSQV